MLALLVLFTLVLLAAVFATALARRGNHREGFDLGAVSTRWLSELRRDEPWTR